MRVALVVVFLASATSALAQAPEPSQAGKLFEEGRALLVAGNAKDACGKFEQVLQLEPEDLGAILNLGLCNEQLDKLATALKWFRRAQVRASELGKEDSEAAAKAKTVALAAKVPTLKIALAPHDGSAAVRIDGTVIDDIDFGRVEVDAGHHVLEVQSGGERSHEDIEIGDGKVERVALAVPRPKPAPVKRTVLIDAGISQRKQAYIIGGVGAGLFVGAGVLGLVGRSEYQGTENPEIQHRWQNVVRYGVTSMAVVGAAGIAIAVWRYVNAPGLERVEQTVVVPTAGRDSMGLAVSGAF